MGPPDGTADWGGGYAPGDDVAPGGVVHASINSPSPGAPMIAFLAPALR